MPEPKAKSASAVGVKVALAAAALFGCSTPLAKMLLAELPPVMLAGLLYLGSGVGLSLVRFARRSVSREAPLVRADIPWLASATLFGGVLGPVLLMYGLATSSSSAASLLLNLEGVFTAFLAWFVFKENFDHRIFLGMVLILMGGVLLSWQSSVSLPVGSLAVAGACLCWGIDNNLTQRVSAGDPMQVAAIKGTVAGGVNLTAALLMGAKLPGVAAVAGSLVVGFLGYGCSLALFVLALRHIGVARTGAYFSLAPFVGAAVSMVMLRETLSPSFIGAAVLMGLGVWLHLTERHEHPHAHEAMSHTHPHLHDDHHQHTHGLEVDPSKPHTHPHDHFPLTHTHPHYPDIHHRHGHLRREPATDTAPIESAAPGS